MADEFNMNDVAEEMIHNVYPDLLEEVEKFERPQEYEIKLAAEEFLQAYQEAMASFTIDAKWNNKSISRHQKGHLYKEKVYAAFSKFQNLINAYQNQIVKVLYTYMDDNGKITLAVLENNDEHLSLQKQDPRYFLNKVENQLKFLDYDSTLLDITEQSVYTRWQIAASKRKKRTQAQGLIILWYVGKWYGAKVSNLGTIAEAYARLYLAKAQFSGHLEIDVGSYINGCAAVDNASGFLQGDSETKFGDVSVQWAVKKAWAAPPNMKEVYDAVNSIEGEFTVEKFLTNFNEKAKSTNNQAKEIIGAQLGGKVRQLSSLYDEKEIGKSYKQIPVSLKLG